MKETLTIILNFLQKYGSYQSCQIRRYLRLYHHLHHSCLLRWFLKKQYIQQRSLSFSYFSFEGIYLEFLDYFIAGDWSFSPDFFLSCSWTHSWTLRLSSRSNASSWGSPVSVERGFDSNAELGSYLFTLNMIIKDF